MKKYLFLDFDGVLIFSMNAMGHMHQSIGLLEDFLRQHSDVSVVFSTSWRNLRSHEDLVNLFASDVRGQFVGSTPYMGSDTRGLRQREIMYYLRAEPDALWAALDDRLDLFDTGCANLVHVSHTDCNCIKAEDIKKLEVYYG